MPEIEPFAINREKLDQAVQVLQEKDIDLWITFARETTQVRDPSVGLLVGFDLTWHSALMVSRTGKRIAIVGRFDAANVENTGGFTTVVAYDQSIRDPLREWVSELNPRTIALNYSENDPSADGLTHGMFRTLANILGGTEYAARFISAEPIIAALRGRKTPTEVGYIRAAIGATEGILREVEALVKPGMSELEIADFIHRTVTERGLGVAWEWDMCPLVVAGPEGTFGHRMPGEYKTQLGGLLQIDFGAAREGFVADLQRTMYFCHPGEKALPDEVERAWRAVRAAIEAARAALKPGARGWEVDTAARSTLVAAGYPEYMHATGHHIGRTAHDGATVLGPKWERYGKSIEGVIEAGNVFAIELGAHVPGYGYLGCEEDVLVTPNGAEYLSEVQEEIWLIRETPELRRARKSEKAARS